MKKHDSKTYFILLIIFILAFGTSYLVPMSEIMKGVVAAPGVLALLATLFQLVRDQAAYERQLDIQSKQFQFTLGAASHLANTTFDKHSKFCECYMSEIHNTVSTLFREAETEKALDHAGNFFKIRQEYAVWLTSEIDEELDKFESAIRTLGANSHFVNVTIGSKQHAEKRSMTIESNFTLFNEILGLGKKDDINEDYAVKAIKKKVRNILGVEELSMLRKYAIKEASNVLEINHT